jgi:hypothetical protein
MIIKANDIRLQYNEAGGAELVLSCTSKPDISEAKEVIAKGKALSVEIKQHRQKRSLDSNAYAWAMINEIGNVLRMSKDEVYLMMLKRYGQSAIISVQDIAVETLRKTVKYYEEIGEATLNGKHFKHFKVYAGSSEYDTREMSIFIDGIVSEAKDLGIETMTPDELANLKSQWGA